MSTLSKNDKSNNKLERLKHLVPLNTLSSEALKGLLRQSQFETLRKGDALFKAGDTNPHNVYLVTGAVDLLEDGKVVDTIEDAAPNARFPIAHQIPRKLGARAAARKVEIVRIDNRQLSALLNKEDAETYEVAELDSAAGADDWMAQLLESPVFQRLPAASIQGVMMHMEEVALKKGANVILEGEEGDYFYLVNKGQVQVVTGAADGEPHTKAKLDPGSIFGEESLLSGETRNATVTMLTDGVLLRLDKDNFYRFIKQPLGNDLSAEEAARHAQAGAVWLDVRPPQDFAAQHIEGARNFPMRDIRHRYQDLEAEKSYICYCENGAQSTSAAFLLVERGLDAWHLHGGLAKSGKHFGVAANGSAVALEPAEKPTKTSLEEEVSKEYENRLNNARDAIGASRDLTSPGGADNDVERKRMRDALMQLKKALAAKNEELKQVKTHAQQAEEMRSRLSQMEGMLQSEKSKSDQSTQDKADYDAKLQKNAEKYKEYIRRQESEQGQLQDELNKALARLEELEQERLKMAELQQDLEAAKAERAAYQKKIDDFNAQQNRRQQALKGAAERIGKLDAELAAKSAAGDRLTQLQAELESAKGERGQAEKAIADLKRKQQAARDRLNSANTRIQGLESDLTAREGSETQQEEDYQQSLGKLESKLEQARSAQQEASAHSKEVEQERKRLSDELHSMRSQLKDVQEQAGRDVARLQQELQKTQSRLESGPSDGKEQQALKTNLESLQKNLQRKQQELEDSEQERAGLKEFLDSRSNELHSLKTALTDAQVEAEEAAFRRQEAEEARKQVEEALFKLQEQVEKDKVKQAAVPEMPQEIEPPAASSVRAGLVGLIVGVLLLGIAGGVLLFTPFGKALISGGEEPPQVVTRPETTPEETAPSTDEGQPETAPEEDPETAEEAPVAFDESLVDRSDEPPTGTVMQDQLQSGAPAPELVYIRGGRFIMGDPHSIMTSDERPAHEVTLDSFAIGRYEVSFVQYDAFAQATGRPLPDAVGSRDNHPVINVTWDDAVAYTEWLSAQSGENYRLPTEAEWEYAAAAGTQTPYWWGEKPGMNKANCFNCSSRWDGRGTAPIGSFKPNPWGLHNTAGNVMEWVQDCYHSNYNGAPDDGSAWEKARCNLRSVRGGAYNRPTESIRTTKRGYLEQKEYIPIIGFRVARDVATNSE